MAFYITLPGTGKDWGLFLHGGREIFLIDRLDGFGGVVLLFLGESAPILDDVVVLFSFWDGCCGCWDGFGCVECCVCCVVCRSVLDG